MYLIYEINPFKADNELVALFLQNIVDHVYTNDRNLSVLVCNGILNIKKYLSGEVNF